MSSEVVSGLIGALATLLTALGLFLARSKLSDVISSGSHREETAVSKMALLLESNATRDEKREEKLLAMLDKALDTVTRLTQNVTQIALQLQGHEHSENLRWSQDVETSKGITVTLAEIQVTLENLEKLLKELKIEHRRDMVPRDRREKVVSAKKEANTDEN